MSQAVSRRTGLLGGLSLSSLVAACGGGGGGGGSDGSSAGTITTTFTATTTALRSTGGSETVAKGTSGDDAYQNESLKVAATAATASVNSAVLVPASTPSVPRYVDGQGGG